MVLWGTVQGLGLWWWCGGGGGGPRRDCGAHVLAIMSLQQRLYFSCTELVDHRAGNIDPIIPASEALCSRS